MPKTSYLGQTALITGGSSGIGLALGKELAGLGAHVWLLARDPNRLDQACQQVCEARIDAAQEVHILQADVTDFETLTKKLQPFLPPNAPPDMLFNSAGITHPAFFPDVPIEIHRRNMELNYFGSLHTIHLLVPGMIARGSGHIVNISSIAGYHGVLGYSSYSPSKFAVRGLSDVLYYELKPHGVHVSIVFPPNTDTPQLVEENKIKPPLLKAMEDANNKVLQPDAVARYILREMRRGRYLIAPGFESAMFYTLNSLPWHLPYRIMEYLISDARRKIAKNQARH